MQSTQAQYRREALYEAGKQYLEIVQESKTKIYAKLTGVMPNQVDEKSISSWLHTIKCSNKIVLLATRLLEDRSMKSIDASKALDKMAAAFYTNMDCFLTDGLTELKELEKTGSEDDCKRGLSLLAYSFKEECNKLEDYVEHVLMEIMDEIKDVDDIEALSTRNAPALFDTQESEKRVNRNQARKRKVEDQSLEDESVSSKRRNDTQPVVTENVYEPDTTMSSATFSAYESTVGMLTKCNII